MLMKDKRSIYRCSYGIIRVNGENENSFEFGLNPYLMNDAYKLDINARVPLFPQFLESNEFLIGECIDTSKSSDELIAQYNKLICSSMKMRLLSRGYDESLSTNLCRQILDWLSETDFYVAPASSRFHESFKHGLLIHTLNVYNNICDLWKLNKFKEVDIYSASLVALVHDWCKIGLYSTYLKNVKENGSWKQVEAYSRNRPSYPLGHGEASMFIADRFCKLTSEEALAIRWHMGKWYCHDALDNDLQTANESYPLVHMLQFADQLSIVNY